MLEPNDDPVTHSQTFLDLCLHVHAAWGPPSTTLHVHTSTCFPYRSWDLHPSISFVYRIVQVVTHAALSPLRKRQHDNQALHHRAGVSPSQDPSPLTLTGSASGTRPTQRHEIGRSEIKILWGTQDLTTFDKTKKKEGNARKYDRIHQKVLRRSVPRQTPMRNRLPQQGRFRPASHHMRLHRNQPTFVSGKTGTSRGRMSAALLPRQTSHSPSGRPE